MDGTGGTPKKQLKSSLSPQTSLYRNNYIVTVVTCTMLNRDADRHTSGSVQGPALFYSSNNVSFPCSSGNVCLYDLIGFLRDFLYRPNILICNLVCIAVCEVQAVLHTCRQCSLKILSLSVSGSSR